ncbi:hypothetical protein G6N76_19575 [Rhizobium daejeonense]|uniref:Uncharacterized protein n=1 Tax=Rhizobium daejeonense TaxID=240521 RepID=A0A6M1S3V2_9HYPH|nr:hypothetical protein [Rhizobium daejeonense]NGO65879.1 hypothetical protein [Rhizobium daejeonense]
MNKTQLNRLICRKIENIESVEDFPSYVRRTKTVCIYAKDRLGIRSKGLVRITAYRDGAQVGSGVFCVDARGSKSGHLTAHETHLKDMGIAAEEALDFEISEASAADCAAWLSDNEDPERKAFGKILETSLDASRQAAEASIRARQNLDQAHLSEERAKIDKEKSYIYAIAAFVAGSLLDVGMIQEKFAIDIPKSVIIISAALAVILFVFAAKIAAMFRKLNGNKAALERQSVGG